MRTIKLIGIAIAVSVVFIGLSFIFSSLEQAEARRLNYATKTRYGLIVSTYQFNFTSAQMSHYARIFAITGAEAYYNAYQSLGGHKTMFENTVHMFDEYGASSKELELLNRAMLLCDNLRNIELLAIYARLAGDPEQALSLLMPSSSLIGNEFSNLNTELEYVLGSLRDSVLIRTGYIIENAEIYRLIYDAFANLFLILFAILIIGTVLYSIVELQTINASEKKLELELENTVSKNQSIGKENRSKSRFLARMSHEMRTPLNAVLGISEIWLQKKDLSPDVEESFKRIYNSSTLLVNIINDILDLSRVESGKIEIAAEKYDVEHLILETIQLNTVYMRNKQLKFKCQVGANIPEKLIGDEVKIKQVMNNILSNAFKYSEKGTVSLSINVEGEGPNIILVCQISDTGQGMTVEQVDRLFDEFARFNSRVNRSVEGSGLGLSIVKRLIEVMDGSINVNSKINEGTTFTIRIPQKISGSRLLSINAIEKLQNLKISAMQVDKRAFSFKRKYMPNGRVLIVDDVESNLYVIKEHLRPYGLNVEVVTNGKEAVHLIEAGNRYDIVFMDYMMPEMDGMEATKKIRGLGYNAPIVALTANTIKGSKELFMGNGFTNFVSKPIDARELDKTLKKYIPEQYENAYSAYLQNPEYIQGTLYEEEHLEEYQ